MEIENNTQIEQPKRFDQLYKVTPLSKYLAMVLFIIMPFIGGWIGYRYMPEKVVEIEKLIVEPAPVNLTAEVSTDAKYKKTFLGGEIPYEWNELSVFERIVSKGDSIQFPNLRYSIAPEAIMFGDAAWSQIDFYYLAEGVADELIDRVSEWEGTQISSTTLSGRPSLIIQYPLDNGEVTKAGTGGISYIIEIPENQIIDETHPRHLLIAKQALGDQDFEDAFKHYLETADFSNLLNK